MMIGNCVLGVTPKIVLSLSEAVLPGHKKGVSRPFDMVEMRIDLFNLSDEKLFRFTDSLAAYPTIATIRSKCEGGQWRLPESKRLTLFKKIMPSVGAVDIELSSKNILGDVISCAHDFNKKVIVSYHNFDGTPTYRKLDQIFNQAEKVGADIVKVAVLSKRDSDIQRVARFTIEHANQNIVTLAMGDSGALSRLFFPALGSLFTYGYMGKPTAPGQMDCHELSRLMKFFYTSRQGSVV